MIKLLKLFFIIPALIYFAGCSTPINPTYSKLIGSWHLDSTKISRKNILQSKYQTITFNLDSTYVVNNSQGDIIEIRKGNYNLISAGELKGTVLIFTTNKGDIDSSTILLLKDDALCVENKSKYRNFNNEIKEYLLTNYFSKVKNKNYKLYFYKVMPLLVLSPTKKNIFNLAGDNTCKG